MSFEWEKIKLGELFDLIPGYAFKSKDFVDSGFPVLKIKNIKPFGLKLDELAYVPIILKDEKSKYIAKEDDLLISMSGNRFDGSRDTWVGKVSYNKHCNRFLVNQRVGILRKKKKISSKFFSYYLSTEDFQVHFISIANSSGGQANISPDQIKSSIVDLPPIQEQKAIADILSALDDKIELNQAINKNLEEMAQAIFKRWFVDFEFPNENGEPYKSSGGEMVESKLGLIPKGWGVGELGSYSTVKSGFAFKSSWWQEEGYKVIKIKNIGSKSLNLEDVDCVSAEKSEIAKKYIAKPGDILIAMTGATVGKFCMVPRLEDKTFVNQRVGLFDLGDYPFEKAPFLFCVLSQSHITEQIITNASGSAQPNISPDGIGKMKIVISPESLINLFNEIFIDGFKQISELNYEISKLTSLRDTLLPKLMSGEIRVAFDA